MQTLHDPGGKVLIPLPHCIKGGAIYTGNRGCYRTILTRVWDTSKFTLLNIGMNPSTAGAMDNDPTLAKDTLMARAWGFGELVKMNVMDYRTTNPKNLLNTNIEPCSVANHQNILKEAKKAHTVLCTWGNPTKQNMHYYLTLEHLLLEHKINLRCLGTNKNGSPKHPLYLKNDVTMRKYVPRKQA